VVFALAAGCSKDYSISIEREDLAAFPIGMFEDELDLFNLEQRGGMKKTEFAMRDGQFFIANGTGAKVVRYNSYGDLLFMIYNEETNPRLLNLKQKSEDADETRWAYAWDLRQPSHIAVDSQKNIFVVDKLPPERNSYNAAEKAVLDSIVLCFDNTGRFIEYLGQEGRGGTPFSRIEGIWTTVNDDIVVVCRTSRGINAFRFDSAGNHQTTLTFQNEKLPVPSGNQGLITSFESVAVAPDKAVIYLKMNYYREIVDPSVNTAAGVAAESSWLWLVDMDTGEYIRGVDIPFYVPDEGENALYALFGAANNEKVFLYTPVEEGFAILILQTDGSNKQRRGVIRVNSDELQFITFNISFDGVLSALLADDFNVRIVWWRTDRLAREM
jgi:hypothetical protein